MQMFTIESQSKYMLCIATVKDIEDITDDFVTAEELCEMLGQEYDEQRQYYSFAGNTLRKDAIIAELTILKNEMVTQNKKSIIIKDDDLVAAISGMNMSYFMEGLRRIGNRLYLVGTPVKRARKAHATTLALCVQRTVNKQSPVELTLKYVMHDIPAAINLCKKLIEWEQIEWIKYGEVVPTEDIEFCKQIWDNPNLFDK